ncbi:MAG: polysaccharide deacetylase family protein [Desulfotomaculaceae bacterium]|nr:polysaccharide deacetylase family protein [Desulfotomaculaceae bacterium]
MKIYFLDFFKIKRPLQAGLLIGLAAFIFTFVLVQPDQSLPVHTKPQAICKANTSHKVAALTFSINWGGTVPGPVLDILKTQNQPATFFISSAWAQKYPELARRIAAEGHEIGSSLDRQVTPDNSTAAELKEELLSLSKATAEASGGVTPTLLRISHGGWNELFLSAAAEAGYTVVQWNLNSLDIQTPGKDNIVNNVLKGIQPGSIILMNASDTASQTPGALSDVIAGLRAEGYELVTVSSLLKIGQGITD